MALSSVLVVEDDPVICVGLEMALTEAGYETLKSACSYEDALAAINARSFDYCVLDLDLGHSFNGPVPNEPEGKRLLAILQARGVSTVVYSGILDEQQRIRDLDPSVITIDKTEPAQTVIEALGRFNRARTGLPDATSVADSA